MENLTVLYEDNQIVVVIKPQNVPTMADESGDKDMLTLVKEYIKEKYKCVLSQFYVKKADRG